MGMHADLHLSNEYEGAKFEMHSAIHHAPDGSAPLVTISFNNGLLQTVALHTRSLADVEKMAFELNTLAETLHRISVDNADFPEVDNEPLY
jgi:hypothetical protein